MATLCLDFGTSSIRAAIKHGAHTIPLAIATGSQIDNASIPSAVFIPSSAREIYFGVLAHEHAIRGSEARFRALSPKTWLSPSEVQHIDSCVVNGLPLTRKHLIAGLLCVAHKEARRVAAETVHAKRVDVRISHPVWTDTQRKTLLPIYTAFLRYALSEHGSEVEQKMSIPEFADWCASVMSGPLSSPQSIDVEEPVAATLALVPNVKSNNKSATLVVDVGAGTIDIGMFLALVPDPYSAVRRKLIAVATPRSIFGAGDVIDHELLLLLKEKLGSASGTQLGAFQANVRYNKEQLFNRGSLSFRGTRIHIDELISRPRLARMAETLKREVCTILQEARTSLKHHFGVYNHSLETLDVIFAGGGASLGFLQAVIVPAVRATGLPVVPEIHVPEQPESFAVEASFARMAVALGGVASEREWPDTRMKTPAMFKGLSTPVRLPSE